MCSATADCANPSRPQPDGKKIDAATAMHLQKLDDIKALIAAEDFVAPIGLGRIVALYYRSSSLYQIH
jgi:hypothetical protein